MFSSPLVSNMLFATFLGVLGSTPAATENLDGFTLRDWNQMDCRPQRLRSATILNITLPKASSDYLSVFAPDGGYYAVVFPMTRLDLMFTSDELEKLTRLSVGASEAKGVLASERLEPIFTAAGTYTILVGRQFETERPIVNGWCRVSFVRDGS